MLLALPFISRNIDRTFLQHFVAIILMLASVCASADAGRIEAGDGDIRVIADDGSTKASTVGSPVNAGDVVSTAGAQSWAILRMVDGASFTLRPNTRLHIDKYRYDEEQPANSSSWLSLLKGSLRAITGLVGHQNPAAYAINTPTATIGIRGTDHETVVVDEEGATPHVPAGTYDSVNAGETVMHNEHGDLPIQPGKVGFLQRGATEAPKTLNYRPAFFQRYRNFEQSHGIVNVLERLHKSVGGGAFTAHPDLRERLKTEMSRPPEWVKPQAANRARQNFAAQRQARAAANLPGNRPAGNAAAERRARARNQVERAQGNKDKPLQKRWNRKARKNAKG